MMASRRKSTKKTPVRQALKDASVLQKQVTDGIGAVNKSHQAMLADDVRGSFGDSIDLDAALQERHPGENRWDYLLGHNPSERVVAVEPHSAKQDQITTVINKRKAAKEQLARHLKQGARVSKWLWVASGKVYFANTEKARLRLDQNGIEFVGKKVLAKHLPQADAGK
ncbi:MAG: hypothetical protein QNJ97_12500 [Myxococcota bacterium]|nr:hypothetical protein [Myxococcota bacterium]